MVNVVNETTTANTTHQALLIVKNIVINGSYKDEYVNVERDKYLGRQNNIFLSLRLGKYANDANTARCAATATTTTDQLQYFNIQLKDSQDL